MPETFPALRAVVLDATDGRAVAEFYRELLGYEYRRGDEPPPLGMRMALDAITVDRRRSGRDRSQLLRITAPRCAREKDRAQIGRSVVAARIDPVGG